MTTRNAPLTGGWRPSPLMVRILSAFVILAMVIGLVLVGIYGVYALVLLLGGLALYEFNALSDKMGSRAPAWLLFPLGVFFAFSGTALKQVDVTLVLALALVGGLGAFLFLPGQRQGLSRWAMGLAGALYIGMPFNFYLLLYTSKPNGLVWTLFTIFAVVASDAAALLVGSRIGRHPFFATISPKKTVEGAIGGFTFGAAIMTVAGAWWLPAIPIALRALLGIVVVALGITGDLFESMLKRSAGVKDSSSLIPGHGGVLDRIDALLFAAPVYYVMLQLA